MRTDRSELKDLIRSLILRDQGQGHRLSGGLYLRGEQFGRMYGLLLLRRETPPSEMEIMVLVECVSEEFGVKQVFYDRVVSRRADFHVCRIYWFTRGIGRWDRPVQQQLEEE